MAVAGASDEGSAVVCDDRADVCRMVAALLVRTGFGPVVQVDVLPDLRVAVDRYAPAVAVVGLPMLGVAGLGAVGGLLAPHPRLRVVLLSGFTSLRPAALRAGAAALVGEDDPVRLQQHLLRIAVAVGLPQVVQPAPGAPAVKPGSPTG